MLKPREFNGEKSNTHFEYNYNGYKWSVVDIGTMMKGSIAERHFKDQWEAILVNQETNELDTNIQVRDTSKEGLLEILRGYEETTKEISS